MCTPLGMVPASESDVDSFAVEASCESILASPTHVVVDELIEISEEVVTLDTVGFMVPDETLVSIIADSVHDIPAPAIISSLVCSPSDPVVEVLALVILSSPEPSLPSIAEAASVSDVLVPYEVLLTLSPDVLSTQSQFLLRLLLKYLFRASAFSHFSFRRLPSLFLFLLYPSPSYLRPPVLQTLLLPTALSRLGPETPEPQTRCVFRMSSSRDRGGLGLNVVRLK